MTLRPALRLATVCAALLLPSLAAAQTFEIRFDTSSLTASQQTALDPILDASADFWETYVIGYQPGVTLDGVDIDVSVLSIDGTGGVLAQAGVSGFLSNEGGFDFVTNFSATSSQGSMTIDSSDFNNSALLTIVNHEVAHTLGYGILWEQNGLYVNGTGMYTGVAGLAAYQDEFDPNATFVPIELDGADPGTANGHINEVASFGSLENPGTETDPGDVDGVAPTVLIEGSEFFGASLDNELLTGRINTGANAPTQFLSNTSVAFFEDLGYLVELPNPVAAMIPEPSSLVLALVGGVLLPRRRRR